MADITPSFVFSYERRMRAITEVEYARRLSDENTWWNDVCRNTPIEGKTERITWLLSTATIAPVGPTGTGRIPFESMATQTTELTTFRHAAGITVGRDEIEDLTGLNILSEWSSQIGNETAYYPQRLAAQALLNGAATDGSANAYDGIPFFSDITNPHPYNPFDPAKGGYANWLKGDSSGSYPGACPIDDSTTTDVALENLGKAIAYIAAVKMPNGIDPRFLKPAFIVASPRLAPRLRQLLDAKFIAQAASSGGGSGDVMALIKGWGLGTPVIAQELGANFTYTMSMPFVAANGSPSYFTETVTGSDTTFYIVCQELKTTQLGGLLYVLRKPFKVNYYTGDSGGTANSADLDRRNEFEYHVQGRMSVQYGHPYTIFRIDAS